MVCAYDPVGYGIPYNHLLFSDYREQLVEQAVQILIVTLEHDGGVPHPPASPSSIEEQEVRQENGTEISLLVRSDVILKESPTLCAASRP